MRREERRRSPHFVHRHIHFIVKKWKMPKDLQIFSIHVLPYLLEIVFYFLPWNCSNWKKNYEIQICRESNLLFNPTCFALIRILSQKLWPKYQTSFKTPFLTNSIENVWSEDFLLMGPTRFWLVYPMSELVQCLIIILYQYWPLNSLGCLIFTWLDWVVVISIIFWHHLHW